LASDAVCATNIRWGILVKGIGPLASLSNEQCDGLSVAEVLKETVANRFLPTMCRKTNAREANQHHPHDVVRLRHIRAVLIN
jgi:hypothetical protein